MGRQRSFLELPQDLAGMILEDFLTPSEVATLLDTAICNRSHRRSFLNILSTQYAPHCDGYLTLGCLAWLSRRSISPSTISIYGEPGSFRISSKRNVAYLCDVDLQSRGDQIVSFGLNPANIRKLTVEHWLNVDKEKFVFLIKSCPQIVSLSLDDITGLSELETILLSNKQLEQLRCLSLKEAHFPDDLWTKIADNCKRLESFSVVGYSCNNHPENGTLLSIIQNNEKLSEIELSTGESPLDPQIYSALMTKTLHTLAIMVNDIPDSVVVDCLVSCPPKCPTDKNFYLFLSKKRNSHSLVDYKSEAFGAPLKLTLLDFSSVVDVLKNFPLLESLQISQKGLCASLLYPVMALCPLLKELTIGPCPDLTTDNVKHILDCLPHLTALEVKGSELISGIDVQRHLFAIGRAQTVSIKFV